MQSHLPGSNNILLVANYPSDAAYAWWLMEHFWSEIAHRFARRGDKVFLAYPRLSAISPTIANAPITVHELPIPGTSLGEQIRSIRFLREHQIRWVYLTDRSYLSNVYAAWRMVGVRHIIVHDHTPGDRPAMKGVKALLKSWRSRLPWVTADAVFSVSPFMRNRSITNACIPPAKCHVVQNGIRPLPPRDEEARRRIRHEIGATRNTILVVTTGRAHPYKRFDFIIDCAHRIKTLFPHLDIRFVLIGDGPALQSLHEHVARLGLSDIVMLLGFRSNVHDYLFASDIAMHAALGEGFSLSITEYMSAGLPVLVPDIPSVRQAIDDGEQGIVYPSHDAEAAAKILAELSADRDRVLTLGRNAKIKADQEYSLDRCTSDLIDAIEETG